MSISARQSPDPPDHDGCVRRLHDGEDRAAYPTKNYIHCPQSVQEAPHFSRVQVRQKSTVSLLYIVVMFRGKVNARYKTRSVVKIEMRRYALAAPSDWPVCSALQPLHLWYRDVTSIPCHYTSDHKLSIGPSRKYIQASNVTWNAGARDERKLAPHPQQIPSNPTTKASEQSRMLLIIRDELL